MAMRAWRPSMIVLALACTTEQRQLTVCASRTELELGLLQIQKSPIQKSPSGRSCPLPEDAVWAQVRLKGHQPYRMAVSAREDLVSHEIIDKGFWEVEDTSIWGKPGQALDIGGNIGYYTFALATSGWNVTTFEPMARNLEFIRATLCENPHLASRIHLVTFGLGTSNQICTMSAPKDNSGNGLTRCTEDWETNDAEWEKVHFAKAGTFHMRRLDDFLNLVKSIDFIKIDVEGYECEVIRGAGGVDFLKKYKPRLIKSEVWKDMARCSSLDYFSMFEDAGYQFGMDNDPGCQEKSWKNDPEWVHNTKFWAAGANFYMCRKE